MKMSALLRMDNVIVRRSSRLVINGLELTINPGERVVVRGGIGAGKTTLLLTALGLLPAESGEIELMGRACRNDADFAPFCGPIGLLFQDPDDQLIGPTVLEDIEFGPLNLGWSAERAHHAADRVLERIGLEDIAERPIHELSGGEKRLVALAGLLVMEPKLLLLDEPTVSLDAETTARILRVLSESGLSMLIATHDPKCIDALATRSVLLEHGKLQGVVDLTIAPSSMRSPNHNHLGSLEG
jgi:cobalt/nickel transport system ATP-binding protein